MNRRTLLWLALSLAFLVPAFAAADEKGGEPTDEAKIKEKLLGKWKLTEGERGGMPPPEDFLKSFKMEFKKDGKFTVWIGEQEMEGDFTINTKGKVWEIDFKLNEGVRRAIFKFDGEKMKATVSEPDGDRPKDFASKDGSTDYYFVFEKMKPEEKKDKEGEKKDN